MATLVAQLVQESNDEEFPLSRRRSSVEVADVGFQRLEGDRSSRSLREHSPEVSPHDRVPYDVLLW
jgi:hypothetical protein